MGYTEDSLIPVMQHIAKNVVKVNEGLSKHLVSGVEISTEMSSSSCSVYNMIVLSLSQAVKNKYSSQKQMRIASISQLKSSMVKDLAKQVS